jgi:hypothetical protein
MYFDLVDISYLQQTISQCTRFSTWPRLVAGYALPLRLAEFGTVDVQVSARNAQHGGVVDAGVDGGGLEGQKAGSSWFGGGSGVVAGTGTAFDIRVGFVVGDGGGEFMCGRLLKERNILLLPECFLSSFCVFVDAVVDLSLLCQFGLRLLSFGWGESGTICFFNAV